MLYVVVSLAYDVSDNVSQNHYAFSPNPLFVGTFFAGQTLIQLAWIRQLFQRPPLETPAGEPAQLNYVPIYVLGNLCIAGWMLFWNSERFGWAQALVTINSAAQLYAVARLPPLSRATLLTHLVAKTTAGIGIMDFVDNGAVFARVLPPLPLAAKIATAGVFAVAVSVYSSLPCSVIDRCAQSGMSDWIMGGALVFDLLALWSGQQRLDTAWSAQLGWMAAGSAAIVVARNLLFPAQGQVALR